MATEGPGPCPPAEKGAATTERPTDGATTSEHASLKYSLLGPSLTKAGQDAVDQSKVSEIIFNASKGSKFFNREEAKDKILTQRIDEILTKKNRLERLDLSRELRHADNLIAQLEAGRDLSQHIVHVDCDAFYAAVELLDRPELRDKPFAVGGGVLTTCNYVARRFGCRSGMAGFVAKKLCPELILLPLNFDKYIAKATEVREVMAEYDPRFESASIDEAYLNITEYCAAHEMTPEDAVAQMRREVHDKTSITVSAGIAANSKLAKICSNINKPNGQFVLPNERVAIMAFMRDLPCRKVNGVGRVLERELAAIGIKTCGDIYAHRQFLTRLFGEKAYEFLIHCHLGLGRTNIRPADEYERKSVGTESTFNDMSDPMKLREKLRSTARELEGDMRRAGCKGRTLVLKVKLHTYEVYTRQVVTPRAIHLADDLYNCALPILAKLEQEIPGMRIRLMGLRCTHLVSTKKPDTLAFFGLNPRRTGPADSGQGDTKSNAKRRADEGVDEEEERWEQWPEEEMDGYEIDVYGDGMERERGSPPRRHGKEIAPNLLDKTPPQEEWWDCPVCGRPQAAEEKQFNDHIDLCLSRKAIRDTVQETRQPSPVNMGVGPEPKRAKTAGTEKKRGKHATATDPKQKKLCFG